MSAWRRSGLFSFAWSPIDWNGGFVPLEPGTTKNNEGRAFPITPALRAKHGVSFEEAGTVFGDPDALDDPDPRHSEEESRFLRLGRAATGRVLIVADTAA